MAEFKVTSQELVRGAQELEQMNAQLKQKLEQLETEEASLTAMHEGAARDTFHSNFTNGLAQMHGFSGTVQEYAQALQDIAAAYVQAEQQNVDIAQRRN